MLLTGDLGFSAIEPFAAAFPERFFNVGVAEQNMVGVATGLAEAGFVPFVYSIATFATRRPYEFLVNGPLRHELPVRLIGIGGGFDYGHAGPTHHATDDVALMRAQPGVCVIVPADHEQAVKALRHTWDRAGPVYYRLGKDDAPVVPGLRGAFELGRAQRLGDRGGQPGQPVILAMGSVAGEAASAADELARRGLDTSVLVVASVRPAPADDIAAALRHAPLALTVEAHSVDGGLGSLVAEIIAERGLPCRLVRCGMRSTPAGVSGSQGYWLRTHGLSRDALVEQVMTSLGPV
jgi:transketolase